MKVSRGKTREKNLRVEIVQQNLSHFCMCWHIQHWLPIQILPWFHVDDNTLTLFLLRAESEKIKNRSYLDYACLILVWRHLWFNFPRWACANFFLNGFKFDVIWIWAERNKILVIVYNNSTKDRFELRKMEINTIHDIYFI